MLFDPAVAEFLRDVLPGAVFEALLAASTLGDPLAILVVGALAYWFAAHERGGVVLAATVCALAIAVAGKQLLGLPRPPAELWLSDVSGPGLPSGHATGGVVLYGAVAYATRVGRRSIRYVVAGALGLAVGLSRVVLGVHYVADVLAGFALGLVVLGVVVRVGGERNRLLFGVGVVASLLALGLGGTPHPEPWLLLGGAVGGLTWPARPASPAPSRATLAVVGAVVLVAGAAFLAVASTLGGGPALAAGNAVLVAVVFYVPFLLVRTRSLASRYREGRTSPAESSP